MKFASILLMLIVQAHGSLFDDVQDAMSSIRNGFQKLITDVVTDVKDTIDCTVIAVESALSIGVIANYPQNPKCSRVAKGNLNIYDRSNGNGNKETISNIDMVKKKHAVKNVLEKDNDRLYSVNDFLKSELENISLSIKNELNLISSEQKSISDSIIKHINVLHDVEHSSRNKSDVKEIRRILDKTSKMLSINVSSDNSDDDKISNILTSLKHYAPDNDNISDVQSTLSSFEENRFLNDGDVDSKVFPKTFKDIFTKESHTTPDTINDDNESENRTQKSNMTESSRPNTGNHSAQYMDNNNESIESLFGRSSDDVEPSAETLQQAKKLIEDSKNINSILNSFFDKAEESGINVFDNPLE